MLLPLEPEELRLPPPPELELWLELLPELWLLPELKLLPLPELKL